MQVAEEAGIPAGVFNVIPCSRDNVDEVTDVAMESNLVTKFSFTGSTIVGKVCHLFHHRNVFNADDMKQHLHVCFLPSISTELFGLVEFPHCSNFKLFN